MPEARYGLFDRTGDSVPGSAETEHGGEGVVDTPHLAGGEMTDSSAEALRIHRTKLLDEDPSDLAGDLDLRSKRRRPSTARCRRHDHHRARQEFVGLHDHAEALAPLFVPDTAG